MRPLSALRAPRRRLRPRRGERDPGRDVLPEPVLEEGLAHVRAVGAAGLPVLRLPVAVRAEPAPAQPPAGLTMVRGGPAMGSLRFSTLP